MAIARSTGSAGSGIVCVLLGLTLRPYRYRVVANVPRRFRTSLCGLGKGALGPSSNSRASTRRPAHCCAPPPVWGLEPEEASSEHQPRWRITRVSAGQGHAYHQRRRHYRPVRKRHVRSSRTAPERVLRRLLRAARCGANLTRSLAARPWMRAWASDRQRIGRL